MSDSNDGMWFSRDELAGMDSTILDSLQSRDGIEDGAEGKLQYRVTFGEALAMQMLGSVQTSASRRRYQVAYRRRFPENVARLNRIISLRDEIARILGFTSHASIKMEEKMARDFDEVQEALRALATGLSPVAKAEDWELQQHIKCEEPGSSSTLVADWDRRFYTNKFNASRRKLVEGKLAEYFEMGHTWDKILQVYERLFDMHFCELTGKVETWHDSVRVYSAWETCGVDREFLGYLYVDLYEREGKYRNAHTMGIEPSYITADGSHNCAAVALICSFPNASPTKPSLLRHLHMRIIVHEMGHCIHKLVSKTKYALSHSRDFVEIPSRVMEYLTWQPDFLQSVARHYTCVGNNTGDGETDGKLPEDMLEALLNSRGNFRASGTMAAIHRAVFDLDIHSPASHEAAVEMDTTMLWNTSRRDMGCQGSDPADWGWEQAAFGAIFRNYDAGYFGYTTSDAYAADMFATVFGGSLEDGDKMRLFRKKVLEVGSSVSEIQIVEGFLGRKLDVGALLREIIGQSCARLED
ncbi:hypothetical protein JDV02_000639 [Purpureocillium takamizusanense]|uniref:Peptidase M3A/M3B catalytic domain-containing protein n=1 Tax=Purpureocillium takamizusanense TaxID=2060973 RepID=A0A9Q8V6M2_9HYPO|nr:uncharacterized protein JDV02_000639 [Purpureocillium takamizusanense]UNI13952.1 hypothetical protein JDV02_000639 [Purpureocillium takamizusanense]